MRSRLLNTAMLCLGGITALGAVDVIQPQPVEVQAGTDVTWQVAVPDGEQLTLSVRGPESMGAGRMRADFGGAGTFQYPVFLFVGGGEHSDYHGLASWADTFNVLLVAITAGADDDKALAQWEAIRAALPQLPANKQQLFVVDTAADDSQWGQTVAAKGEGIDGVWLIDPAGGDAPPSEVLLVVERPGGDNLEARFPVRSEDDARNLDVIDRYGRRSIDKDATATWLLVGGLTSDPTLSDEDRQYAAGVMNRQALREPNVLTRLGRIEDMMRAPDALTHSTMDYPRRMWLLEHRKNLLGGSIQEKALSIGALQTSPITAEMEDYRDQLDDQWKQLEREADRDMRKYLRALEDYYEVLGEESEALAAGKLDGKQAKDLIRDYERVAQRHDDQPVAQMAEHRIEDLKLLTQ